MLSEGKKAGGKASECLAHINNRKDTAAVASRPEGCTIKAEHFCPGSRQY